MRGTLPLILAGTCLAILPLMGPAGNSARASIPTPQSLCVAADAGAASQARDWLGSLHGWADSPAVLAYRALIARAKGKPGPAGC